MKPPKDLTVPTWEVYIIETRSGKLYTGITNNLDRRFKEHQTMKKGARFFHLETPEKIVFRETHPNRSSATKKEIEIKALSKEQKHLLIQQNQSDGTHV